MDQNVFVLDPLFCTAHMGKHLVQPLLAQNSWLRVATIPVEQIISPSQFIIKLAAGKFLSYKPTRAVDPHALFMDPDIAVFPQCRSGSESSCILNADPDPAWKKLLKMTS